MSHIGTLILVFIVNRLLMLEPLMSLAIYGKDFVGYEKYQKLLDMLEKPQKMCISFSETPLPPKKKQKRKERGQVTEPLRQMKIRKWMQKLQKRILMILVITFAVFG